MKLGLLVVLGAYAAAPATAAHADPADWNGVPRECRRFLDPKVEAAGGEPAWQQRLSLATCEQPHATPIGATSSLQLRALVDDLARAVQPSVAIYQDAIARAPQPLRAIAARDLGNAYLNVMVLARTAVGPDSTGLAHKDLETMLVGFTRDAQRAFAEADRLGKK